eukprot:5152260-Amphidinium_carterae.1
MVHITVQLLCASNMFWDSNLQSFLHLPSRVMPEQESDFAHNIIVTVVNKYYQLIVDTKC